MKMRRLAFIFALITSIGRADVSFYNSGSSTAHVEVSTTTIATGHQWQHHFIVVYFSGSAYTILDDYDYDMGMQTQYDSNTYDVGPGEWLTINDLNGETETTWEWNTVDDYTMTITTTSTMSSIGRITYDTPSDPPDDPPNVSLVPNFSVAPDVINDGESVTIVRDGSVINGAIAWTEATVWAPDGSYDVLGNSGLGSASYTPHNGPGVYWVQFRLVDVTTNYIDQWVMFVVN